MGLTTVSYGRFKELCVDVSSDLDTDLLHTSSKNERYYTLFNEELRYRIANIIAILINEPVSEKYFNKILYNTYNCNNLEELKRDCKKFHGDYNKIITSINTQCKNLEIQDIYNGSVERAERMIKNNLWQIIFG